MHNKNSDINNNQLTTVSPLAKMVFLVSASISDCFGTPRRLATRWTLLWSGISVASKLSDKTSKCITSNLKKWNHGKEHKNTTAILINFTWFMFHLVLQLQYWTQVTSGNQNKNDTLKYISHSPYKLYELQELVYKAVEKP